MARQKALPFLTFFSCQIHPFVAIDDFALRKRFRYGTLVVDLRTHHPVDLFTGRTEEVTKAWLIKHPTIQTVSRDGSRAYARAIRETSAQIIQVTDRWHILKGLVEAVKEEIYLHFPTKPVGPPLSLRSPAPSSERKSERVREENEAKRWKVIQQVQERQ